jgi:hypothetical protein
MKIKWHKPAQEAIFSRVELYRHKYQNQQFLEELYTVGLLPKEVARPFAITTLNSRVLTHSISDWQGYSSSSLNLIDIHLDLLDILEEVRDRHQRQHALRKLATLPIGLRYQLAQNSSTPVEIKSALLEDKIIEVRLAAARTLVATPEGLEAVQKHYIKRAPAAICVVILLHSQTSPRLLTKMAKYCASDWLVRYTIARHRNTPKQVRHALANDTHYLVRAIAKARFQQQAESDRHDEISAELVRRA